MEKKSLFARPLSVLSGAETLVVVFEEAVGGATGFLSRKNFFQ